MLLFLTSCIKSGLKYINFVAKSGDYESYLDISYGSKPANKLNIYLPKNQKITATIIFYYGGCWGYCNKLDKNDYLFVAETLTKKGYAVVIADYQQYPQVKFDEILTDAKNVTLWVLSHLQHYGITHQNIFIMGHSSGAHIGSMLVADERLLEGNLPTINGFIGLAGPYNFYPFNAEYMYDLFSSSDDYYRSQPINYINGNEPAHLLMQGSNDHKVNVTNAKSLAKKLEKYQVNNTLLLQDNMSHGKILAQFAKPFRENSQVVASLFEFIELNSH